MKQLLVMFMLLCSAAVFAQDVIVKKDGSTVVCRVVELTSSEIVYKKWSDLNGSNYIMSRSDASAINYENGKKVNLSEAGKNLYAPGNQNDGVQQMNDKALLQLDFTASNPYKKAKTLRTIGLVGGGALLLGGGVVYAIFAHDAESDPDLYDILYYVSIPAMSAGVIGGATCLIAAHNIKKKARLIQGLSLYQKEVKFKNGTALTPSVDFLRDQAHNTQTIGLGLHYNF